MPERLPYHGRPVADSRAAAPLFRSASRGCWRTPRTTAPDRENGPARPCGATSRRPPNWPSARGIPTPRCPGRRSSARRCGRRCAIREALLPSPVRRARGRVDLRFHLCRSVVAVIRRGRAPARSPRSDPRRSPVRARCAASGVCPPPQDPSSLNCLWVVEAGWVTTVIESPIIVMFAARCSDSTNRTGALPASLPVRW